MVRITKNVEICVQNVKSIKIWKFDPNGRNRLQCWNLSADVNSKEKNLIEMAVLIKMLKFEWKMSN